MDRNRYDARDCLEIGIGAEDQFSILIQKLGWNIIRSTNEQDISEHWDFEISQFDKRFKVDVKGRKRRYRHAESQQDEWIWIELHGVRFYDEGWLYGSKADLIAFETKDSFIIVERLKLIDLVAKKVDFQMRVNTPQEAEYKVYQRSGRPDLLTLIKRTDLDGIKWTEIQKI
ncbi:MAG: hypothetical protein QME57_03760 [Patescibacteria group bacterium]|nr:hypothetical protein [Patescibacteria group bacterium]